MRDKLYITFLPPYVAPEVEPEPETTLYMTAAGIANDDTVYFTGTAYQILGSAMWTALDNFVIYTKNLFGLQLQTLSLSQQFHFIFPRIGGTATAHAVNLVDGTSGTFSGGWTHDGSGALPNGLTGYFDTGFVCSDFTRSNNSMGFCSKTETNSAGPEADFGSTGGSGGEFLMYTRLSNLLYTRQNDNGVNSTVSNTTSLGVFSMSRTATGSYKVYRDGSLLATHVVTDTNFTARPIIEAAQNSTGGTGISATQYSPRKRTLYFGGLGMSDADMADFVTGWNDLETVLNR